MSRGRRRIGLGAALLAVGIGGLVVGIVQAAQPDPDLEADAVDAARTVEGGLLDVEAEQAGDYTIYVVVPTGHLFGDDAPEVQREAVHSVACEVERPGEAPLMIRGDRHLTGQSTEEAASVGWFSTQAGLVRATCEADGDEGRTVLLVPGKPTIWAGGVVMAVGGTVIALLGGALIWWGARALRPPGVVATDEVASEI